MTIWVASGKDIGLELLDVYEDGGPKHWSFQVHCPKGHSELLISEYGPVVVWVNVSIVLIPLFWIDVPTSS